MLWAARNISCSICNSHWSHRRHIPPARILRLRVCRLLLRSCLKPQSWDCSALPNDLVTMTVASTPKDDGTWLGSCWAQLPGPTPTMEPAVESMARGRSGYPCLLCYYHTLTCQKPEWVSRIRRYRSHAFKACDTCWQDPRQPREPEQMPKSSWTPAQLS